MKRFSGKRVSGFTLIELLVVIAVIAILAGILFPVFAQAREKARQATCASNVKNIVLAHQMYVQDHDEVLPPATTYRCPLEVVYPGMPPNRACPWTQYLQPYLKSRQVLFCPSASTDELARHEQLGNNWATTYWLSDYALVTNGPVGDGTQGNPYIRFPGTQIGTTTLPSGGCSGSLQQVAGGCVAPPTCVDLMTLARVVRPAETMVLVDGFAFVPGGAAGFQWVYGLPRHQMPNFSLLADHSSDGSNRSGMVMGFIDGHVRFMRVPDYLSGVNDNGFWYWRWAAADR